MQKAPGHTGLRLSAPGACKQAVSGTISLPLSGVLFTFPSRYWFTIGRRVVFSLGGWAPQIPTGFHVSRRTWEKNQSPIDFAYGAITRYGPTSQ